MIADLFSVLKTTFLTVRKQQTLNFSYHESSRCQFSQENQRGLKASEQIIYRNDPLSAPEDLMKFHRAVGAPNFAEREGYNELVAVCISIRVGTWPTILGPPNQTPTYNTRPHPTISDPNVPYQTPIESVGFLAVLCVGFNFMLTALPSIQ